MSTVTHSVVYLCVYRLKMLETGEFHRLAGRGTKRKAMDKYTNKAEVKVYNSAADSTLPVKSVEEEEAETKPPKKKVGQLEWCVC